MGPKQENGLYGAKPAASPHADTVWRLSGLGWGADSPLFVNDALMRTTANVRGDFSQMLVPSSAAATEDVEMRITLRQ